jgi:hypothetical protein
MSFFLLAICVIVNIGGKEKLFLLTHAFLLIVLLSGYLLPTPVRSSMDLLTVPIPSAYSEADCHIWINELRQAGDWYDQLIDPVLINESEITEKLEKYSRIHTCLEEVLVRDNPELERIHLLTEYFLIFVGGYKTPEDGSELFLVDLAESDDPAVVKIRDEGGLPPPPGYVFMRLYDSRDSMPPRLQTIFADRVIAGVTIFSRYIAVPTEAGGSIQDQILQQRTLPRTVSHELVHAYVHASLRPRELGTIPEWFNEGVAIYFSGSGEDHVLVTPNVVAARTSTAEYQEYKEIFDYLEYRLGRERFLGLITEAVIEVEPSIVYQPLGINDEAELRVLTREWRARSIRQGQILSLVSVVLLAVFVVWLVPSEARCTCGYAGSRKKFIDDRCPRCRQPLEQKRGIVKRRLRKVMKGCEVCGRKFWFRSVDQVHELSRETAVWIEQEGGVPLAQPQRVRVNRICQECCQTADALEDLHNQKMQKELEEANREAKRVYSDWLSNAPYVTYWFKDGLEMFEFEEVLDHFVRASVYPEFKLWAVEKPEFHFREFYGRKAEDFRVLPPSGYENVLVKRVREGVGHTRMFGTVRRFDGNKIGIYWVPEL